MAISKLSRAEVGDLRHYLAEQRLQNYELLWVLEGCQNSPGSTVAGVGSFPWPAGIILFHRGCFWLRLENEIFMDQLLDCLPRQEVYRVYTTEPSSLDILKRWLPGGELRQSALCVRNVTRSWRKRFSLTPEPIANDNAGEPGVEYHLFDSSHRLVATVKVQTLVAPYQEITDWKFFTESQHSFWLEEIFGAMVNLYMSQQLPLVVRLGEDSLMELVEPLGFREFSPLYYYIGLEE